MMMIRSVVRRVRDSGFTLLDLAVGMMLLGFAVLVAQPVFSSVTRAPEPGAVHTITFAPNGSVDGAGAITFRDLEGNSRMIVVAEDGTVGIR